MSLEQVALQIQAFSGVKATASGDAFIFNISKTNSYKLEAFKCGTLILTFRHPNPYYVLGSDSKIQSFQITGYKPEDRVRVFMETVRKAVIYKRDNSMVRKLSKKFGKLVDKTNEALWDINDDVECAKMINKLWAEKTIDIFKIHRKLFTNSNKSFFTTNIHCEDRYVSFMTSIEDFVNILTGSSDTHNKRVKASLLFEESDL